MFLAVIFCKVFAPVAKLTPMQTFLGSSSVQQSSVLEPHCAHGSLRQTGQVWKNHIHTLRKAEKQPGYTRSKSNTCIHVCGQ